MMDLPKPIDPEKKVNLHLLFILMLSVYQILPHPAIRYCYGWHPKGLERLC
jgi:hypothetical protein